MCREVFLNFTFCGHDRQRNTPCENATYVFESGYRLCGSLTTRNDYFEDTFCEPDCCYSICNQMWHCCECRVPNRNRHDCYGCKHIICPECYPAEDPKEWAARKRQRRVRIQEEGTNPEFAPMETKQDEPHQEPEDEGPSSCQDQENSKVQGNTDNHADAQSHGNSKDQEGPEHTQNKDNDSQPSSRALRRPRPRIPIYDPSVGDWV